MGYYIQADGDKVLSLVREHNAKVVDVKEASETVDNPEKAVVCVKQNPTFTCAGLCFDKEEFDAFADPDDGRKTTWLTMDRKTAARLANYKPWL